MKISLQILLEKLGFNEKEVLLQAPHKSFFSEILLLTPEILHFKKEFLYIGEQYPNNSAVFEPGCGLCIQNDPKNLPCDVLFVKNSISFAELFNKISSIFIRFRALFNKLEELIYHKKGLQNIIEIISDICEHPAYLVDTNFKVAAIIGPQSMYEVSVAWKRLIDTGYLSYDIIVNLIESNELYSMESGKCAELIISKYFYNPFINYNMRHNGILQGHLFIVGTLRKITPGDIELVNYIGPLVLRAILSDPNFQTTRGRLYENFVIDMLEGKNLRLEYINNQMKVLCFNSDSFYNIAVIKPFSPDELKLEQIAEQLERYHDCKPVKYNGNIIGIFQFKTSQKQDEFINKLKKLSINLNCVIGVSDIMQGFLSIHLQYTQALTAISLGESFNDPEKLYVYNNFSIYHPFLYFENINNIKAMCLNEITQLNNYDKEHYTELVLTLDTYLKNERHALLTATALHIHRNTLSYRINKINDICRLNLDDISERERILFSLRIIKYLKDRNM